MFPFRKWFVINIPGNNIAEGFTMSPFIEKYTDDTSHNLGNI